jgi:hypothetical protein
MDETRPDPDPEPDELSDAVLDRVVALLLRADSPVVTEPDRKAS